ncbi:trans-sulfuration enzyme family protein [Paraburkholderia fungorum]|uniref:trans-sulfuration enzyme family protein n=1 Tax=Paraburkholderia fungorum TaxID=134537 RepID=UPI0038BC2280
MRFETLAVHGGHVPDAASGAVAKPITLSVTYQREPDGRYPSGNYYSSKGNPNRDTLEACFASLEGGTQAVAFASGCAAITAVLRLLKPGDHVLVPDDAFQGSIRILRDLMPRWGISYGTVDMTDLRSVAEAITTNTRLIWVETLSNPLLKVTDINAVANLARDAAALCVVDNTFVTPVLQQPLSQGVDLVLHASTKYIGGHGDVLGGIVIGNARSEGLIEQLRQIQSLEGAVPAPFDCWLIHRGLKTLSCRVQTHASNAMQIAKFFSEHELVEKVYYPGLPGHPGHDLATSQLSGGYGGIVSIRPKGGRIAALKIAGAVKVFTNATSFGETESLIQHQATSLTHGTDTGIFDDLLRLSIGLEHPADLIADLVTALHSAHS